MNEIYLVGILIVLVLAVAAFLVVRKINEISEKTKPDENLVEWLKTTSKQLEETNRAFNESLLATNKNITSTLQKNTKDLNERLDKAAAVIGTVGREVGQMAEIGRSMRDLQEFLRSPKLRGNIGEQVLKDLLTQMFPKQSFQMQYSFSSGEKVDAAIKTDAGIIPIDSKFPMENFKKMMGAEGKREKEAARREFVKDVKKHIETIAKKYIVTEEGTIDYALMYIPSESVYYEIIANNPDLYDFSYKKRVLAVSPSTFYAYLQAIMLSFEGKKIEKKARVILANLRALEAESEKLGQGLSVLNRHVTNAFNSMSSVMSGFVGLGQKIKNTQALGGESEELEVGEELERD